MRLDRLRLPDDPRPEGVEGWAALDADGMSVGEVAALNRLPDGLVLLVAPHGEPEALAAVPVARVEAVDDLARTLTLRAGALDGPRLERTAVPAGGSVVVRFLPSELLRLVRRERRVEGMSNWWLLSLVLGTLGGGAFFVAHFLVADLGGGIVWATMAVPALLLIASGAVLLLGLDAPLADKLRLVPASLFGYTPKERRGR